MKYIENLHTNLELDQLKRYLSRRGLNEIPLNSSFSTPLREIALLCLRRDSGLGKP